MLSLDFGAPALAPQLTLGGLNAFAMLLDDKIPNEEAIAIAPTVGWLMLAGALAVCVMLILHADAWRKWWLTVEDPRALAIYRIVFGFFVLCNMNDYFEYFTFLFTDEGIFTADVARQVHASSQFVGFGDGLSEKDPWGFFDWWAVLEFLKGPKYSLLYFWDTPAFFWGHMIAFYVVCTCFIIGFRTRLMGVLTWLLMNSIFFRNHLFWEGTELVYRVFLAYLILARSGHAYSVDNWLRCRRLRRKGLLSERGGPGNGAGAPPSPEHPKGLQAVYRLVPSWPRRLAILQLAVVYTTTGVLKNGSVWARGDAIYYAWNMDHFYRFYPQPISAIFGTNLLRVATWTTHWGEALFFLVVLGILAKWSMNERIQPLRGARAAVMQLCWLALIAVSSAVIYVTWEVHYTPRMPVSGFLAIWAGGLLLLWGLWRRLGRRPLWLRGRVGLWILWSLVIAVVDTLLWVLLFPLAQGQRAFLPNIVWSKVGIMAAFTVVAIALPFVARRVPPLLRLARRVPLFRPEFLDTKHAIDRRWIATWVLGRRIWVTWHILLMGGIFTLMNIGQFQTGMLSQAFLFLTGAEVAIILHFVGYRLKLTRHREPIPAEDPALPHHQRDASFVPQWAMLIALAVFVAGIVARVFLVEDPKTAAWDWRWIWVVGYAFVAGAAAWQAWASRRQPLSIIDPATDRPRTPWAYGPFGRFFVSSLLIWQITAVAVWLLPDKDSLETWRPAAREVFHDWLVTTQTDQGWGMFAPNPPRSNVFLKVLVTDEEGEVYDLKTDVYAPERKPIPWIWNDRMRKMNRRIIGGESGNTQWYRKWYARYICRDWGMKHDGIEPKKVDLVKVWYRIPPPEETYEKGWYKPEDLLERAGAEKIEHTEYCRNTVMGQISPEIRERHGLPPLREGWTYRPWHKNKKEKWERRMKAWREERERAENGESPAAETKPKRPSTPTPAASPKQGAPASPPAGQ